ncbi:hypothetical protein MmiHf6_17180 [Methanimicrococcus hongohii]|uniref:Uncharacterized protein n=1 Tax=Methanimicrococcus hongohii TaxID=3028295 RepID=A0AA96V0Z4_9EURY|nr:hypothetical protein [Methanimicrococcus sp. Hf6]WNY24387.1 hypothetical protein MmiHf6_17180 [Methanimicrococcus sp. Hf6]
MDEYNGHIHYAVNGYKPLAWAIPLDSDDFPVKELAERDDYIKTLKAFFDKINLKTIINYGFQKNLRDLYELGK